MKFEGNLDMKEIILRHFLGLFLGIAGGFFGSLRITNLLCVGGVFSCYDSNGYFRLVSDILFNGH